MLVKGRVAGPANAFQAVLDIGLDFGCLHRIKVMRRDHPLAQLFKLGVILDHAAKLWLTQQQRLQQRMRPQLKIGQHPQLFQRLDRQVLRFVDHQQTAPPGAGLVMQERFDRAECRGLVMPLHDQPKRLRHDMNQLLAIKFAGNDLRCGQPRRIDRRHQMRDQRGLARANLAGDHHKAFALRQAIAQIGQRLAVRHAFKIKRRIWGKLERPSGKPIEIIEHFNSLPQAQNE